MEESDIPYVHIVMKYASYIGSSEFILIATFLTALVLLVKRNWRHFFFLFVVSIGGVILNWVLKVLIRRARPGDAINYIEVFNLNLEIHSYSFPSGHTMRATILLLFLMYITYRLVKKPMIKYITYFIFTFLIVIVALSRIILDAHFVTDVVGAVLISISLFFLCGFFFHQSKQDSYPVNLQR